MARIEITDLPKDMKIGKEEMRRVRGGVLVTRMTRVADHKVEYNSMAISDGMQMGRLDRPVGPLT